MALLVAGCGAPATDGTPTETTASTAQALHGAYPHGPYGTTVGDTLANAEFSGKTHPTDQYDVASPLHTMSFGDYLPRAGVKTRVLVVSLCALWCGPCNFEAPHLVQLYRDYETSAPGKVMFVNAVAEQANGSAPNERTLDQWTTRFKVPYDAILDPNGATLLKYENSTPGQEYFPSHLVVTTTRMKIAAQVQGGQVDVLKADIDAALAQAAANDDAAGDD